MRKFCQLSPMFLISRKKFTARVSGLYFLEHLRGEKKFVNVQDLIDQIGNDIAKARGILKLCSIK